MVFLYSRNQLEIYPGRMSLIPYHYADIDVKAIEAVSLRRITAAVPLRSTILLVRVGEAINAV